MGHRVKPPVQPLRYVNFIKVIFRPTKRLNQCKVGFRRGPQTFTQCCQERQNSTVPITIFCMFCFETVARGLNDVSNNQLKFAHVPGIRFV